MDNYLYEDTLEPPMMGEPMTNKEMLWVNDMNNASYNGQIQIDTSILANSGKWLDYQNAYLEVPFVISMKSDAKVPTLPNAWSLALKNGSFNIIDSIQVDWNNKNVIQLQNNLNAFCSWKLMSTWSKDDCKKFGPSIMFSPDTGESAVFASGAAAGGEGTRNNRTYRLLAQDYTNLTGCESFNQGLRDRIKYGNSLSYLTQGACSGNGANPALGGTLAAGGNLKASGLGNNYVYDNAGVDEARVWSWVYLLTIRLKDIADLFDKMPLVKGAFLKFTINYNSCRQVLTYAGAEGAITFTSNTQLSGRTCPYLMTSNIAGNPNAAITAAAITVECGVVRNSLNAAPAQAFNNVRLYVPSYTLNSTYESQLLDMRPTREIVYEDIYNYTISNQTQNINQILTNGIANAKYIVVIPILSTASDGITIATAGPAQSPFDTVPSTSSPYCALSNFNVQISGKNIFQQNVQYDFDLFMDELSSLNAINGGATEGLTNGLIGVSEFQSIYRYYVANIARRLPAEDNIPKSVVLSATNSTGQTLDFQCFIVFNRKIVVDMFTGALIG